jgi:hypothetical protein
VVKPYLDAGAAWDTLPGLKQAITSASPALVLLPAPVVNRNTTMGFVVGGGVDIHAVFLHISPEIRFTRWNATQISDSLGLLHSNLNQGEFLVGITF